jgi:hypothetical protein
MPPKTTHYQLGQEILQDTSRFIQWLGQRLPKLRENNTAAATRRTTPQQAAKLRLMTEAYHTRTNVAFYQRTGNLEQIVIAFNEFCQFHPKGRENYGLATQSLGELDNTLETCKLKIQKALSGTQKLEFIQISIAHNCFYLSYFLRDLLQDLKLSAPSDSVSASTTRPRFDMEALAAQIDRLQEKLEPISDSDSASDTETYATQEIITGDEQASDDDEAEEATKVTTARIATPPQARTAGRKRAPSAATPVTRSRQDIKRARTTPASAGTDSASSAGTPAAPKRTTTPHGFFSRKNRGRPQASSASSRSLSAETSSTKRT